VQTRKSVGPCIPRSALILRRANVSRKGGPWQHEDYDVFDGEREVGRIYLIDSFGRSGDLVLGSVVPAIHAVQLSVDASRGRVKGDPQEQVHYCGKTW
jgi:hypothetical protein